MYICVCVWPGHHPGMKCICIYVYMCGRRPTSACTYVCIYVCVAGGTPAICTYAPGVGPRPIIHTIDFHHFCVFAPMAPVLSKTKGSFAKGRP